MNAFISTTAKLRKTIAAIVVALAALLLTGCGASVTVSAYTENGTRYNEYTVEIDRAVVQKMEESAIEGDNGEKYTVSGYLFELFSGYGCELIDSGARKDKFFVIYRKAFSSVEDPSKKPSPAAFVTDSRLHDITEQIFYETDLTRNPFVRHYTSVSPDPFNGIRQAYESVLPGQSATVIQRLKNGLVTTIVSTGERVTLLPSVQDAFPYLKGADVSGLELRYAYLGSKRMESSGKSVEVNDDYAQYIFSRYFDSSEREIAFEYSRPEVYGWYLVALAAGGITIAVFVLVTRTKKQKPTLLDRFPYNPEEYRDYETRLPSA